MNLFTWTAAILISALTSVTWAHEGHDHDAPATLQAPKGGIVKSLEETYVEVVPGKDSVKLYLYDKELKPKYPDNFKISAEAEHPRKKTKEKIDVSIKKDVVEMRYDAKGLHRYNLILAIVDPATKHNEKLTFVIEPK